MLANRKYNLIDYFEMVNNFDCLHNYDIELAEQTRDYSQEIQLSIDGIVNSVNETSDLALNNTNNVSKTNNLKILLPLCNHCAVIGQKTQKLRGKEKYHAKENNRKAAAKAQCYADDMGNRF